MGNLVVKEPEVQELEPEQSVSEWVQPGPLLRQTFLGLVSTNLDWSSWNSTNLLRVLVYLISTPAALHRLQVDPSHGTLNFRFKAANASGSPVRGNSNQGHQYGTDRFSEEDRQNLLEYLKTL